MTARMSTCSKVMPAAERGRRTQRRRSPSTEQRLMFLCENSKNLFRSFPPRRNTQEFMTNVFTLADVGFKRACLLQGVKRVRSSLAHTRFRRLALRCRTWPAPAALRARRPPPRSSRPKSSGILGSACRHDTSATFAPSVTGAGRARPSDEVQRRLSSSPGWPPGSLGSPEAGSRGAAT
jgi:hypothetical protein